MAGPSSNGFWISGVSVSLLRCSDDPEHRQRRPTTAAPATQRHQVDLRFSIVATFYTCVRLSLVVTVEMPSPWRVVLSLVERFEEALVITWAFEYRDATLLANGRSIAEILEALPSERGVAALLANRMLELEGGAWSSADFYRPTRGNLTPTAEEIRAFLERCEEAGVALTYDDGTRPEPSP